MVVAELVWEMDLAKEMDMDLGDLWGTGMSPHHHIPRKGCHLDSTAAV